MTTQAPTDIESRTRGRRLVLASRGDALTPYLRSALARRYPDLGQLDPELNRVQRYALAAATFRPTRTAWAEQFYKSNLGYAMRTSNARRRRDSAGEPVLQVHALFDVPGASTLLYVDCTHRQSVEQWPAWNPLRGAALRRWYARETDAYLAARHVFAFSRETQRSLVADYGVPADRVSVVGAGINVHALPEPSTGPASPPTILFVGNDFERKGGPALLEAFTLVRQAVPDSRLVLVGTTPPVAPSPGVEVLGRVRDRGRVLALYRDASVFCLPSVFDPFPLVLLEAMAHALPVVATTTCGVPDILTHGEDGLLVPMQDPSALAATVIGVLQDRQAAAALGEAARRRVLGAFTWDHVVARMAPVVDRVLSE